VTGERFESGGTVAWRPTREYIEHSRLKAFIDRHGLRDYPDLLRAVRLGSGLVSGPRCSRISTSSSTNRTARSSISHADRLPRWCVGGRLNIVHNCLDKRRGTPDEHRIAVRWEGEEDGARRELTYGALLDEVNRCANAFAALGVTKGDRVALFMPMCPELIVAFFAAIKLGALVLPLFSGYGTDAVVARLRDAR
jgi:acetyl-CoA synthetase